MRQEGARASASRAEQQTAQAAARNAVTGGAIGPSRMRAQLEELARGQRVLMEALERLEARMDARGAAPSADPMSA